MKINWKVRFTNPAFWAHIAISFFVPIFTHFGLNWAQMTTWSALFGIVLQAFQNPVVVAAIAVSVWNCIVDPTTKGLSDSAQVLSGTTAQEN